MVQVRHPVQRVLSKKNPYCVIIYLPSYAFVTWTMMEFAGPLPRESGFGR